MSSKKQDKYLSWIETRIYELQFKELKKKDVDKIKQAFDLLMEVDDE